MYSKPSKRRAIWQPKRNQSLTRPTLPTNLSFEQLKSMSKHIGIIHRLQQKQWNKSNYQKQYNKIHLNTIDKRPTTVDTSKIRNLGSAAKACRQEKQLNQVLITEKYKDSVKSAVKEQNEDVKEGLLGEYQRYNQMSKQELIEKLISLEYLANNIFRKNKLLEEKLRSTGSFYQEI